PTKAIVSSSTKSPTTKRRASKPSKLSNKFATNTRCKKFVNTSTKPFLSSPELPNSSASQPYQAAPAPSSSACTTSSVNPNSSTTPSTPAKSWKSSNRATISSTLSTPS